MKKWNIIFLIHSELSTNESTNKSSTNSPETQINEASFSDNHRLLLIKCIIEKDRPLRASTKLFLKQVDNSLILIKSFFGRAILQEKDKLADIFTFITQHYPSEKILLCTIGHGSAYGIFKQQIEVHKSGLDFSQQTQGKLQRKKNIGEVVLPHGSWQSDCRAHHGVFSDLKTQDKCCDQKSYVILTINEFAYAIEKGFRQKIEVLIMANCTMQNVHSCYFLEKAVSHVVAPQGSFSLPGYDYSALINAVKNNSAVSGLELAVLAVQSLKTGFKHMQHKAESSSAAVFAITLCRFPEFVHILSNFISELTNIILTDKKMKQEWRLKRDKCFPYDMPQAYYMVDFLNWVFFILGSLPDVHIIHALFMNMRLLYDGMIVSRFIGKNVFEDVKQCLEAGRGIAPSGAAIHFPPDYIRKENNISPVSQSHFSCPEIFYKETGWDVFVKELNSIP